MGLGITITLASVRMQGTIPGGNGPVGYAGFESS